MEWRITMIKEKISAFFLVQELKNDTPLARGAVKKFSGLPLYESSVRPEDKGMIPEGPVAKAIFFNLEIGKIYKLGISVKDGNGNHLAPESYGPFDFTRPIKDTSQNVKIVGEKKYGISSMYFTLPDFTIFEPDEIEFKIWISDNEDRRLDVAKTYLRIDLADE